QTVEQGGLAGAEKAGEHGERQRWRRTARRGASVRPTYHVIRHGRCGDEVAALEVPAPRAVPADAPELPDDVVAGLRLCLAGSGAGALAGVVSAAGAGFGLRFCAAGFGSGLTSAVSGLPGFFGGPTNTTTGAIEGISGPRIEAPLAVWLRASCVIEL